MACIKTIHTRRKRQDIDELTISKARVVGGRSSQENEVNGESGGYKGVRKEGKAFEDGNL